MEGEEYFHLSPMRGVGGVGIPNCICSSMGNPYADLAPWAYTGSKLDLPPFDVIHRLVASFVILG